MKTSKFKALERMTVAHSHKACMKRIQLFLVSAAVLLAVTACIDNIESPVSLSGNAMMIRPADDYAVSAVDSLPEDQDSFIAAMPKTKAPVSSFPTDFGVTLSASHSSAGSYMVGIPFSRNSSDVWEPSTTKYWPQSGTLNFLGFAKKQLSVSNVYWNADPSYQVSMTVGDNSSLQEDLMFTAASSVGKQTTAYPLSFSHAMANLQFTVAAPDGAYNSSSNTGITVNGVTLVNVYNSGNVTATRSGSSVSCSWSSLGNRKNLAAPGISNVSVGTGATQLGVGLVVVPQTCVGVQIEYVLHNGKDASGNAVNLTRTYTYTPSGSWSAGNKYTIAFSISQGQVSATASLSVWTNATQPWFYATGNAVSHLGSNFSFTSGNLPNIWWRLNGSSSYEPLTYVEGTWGNSVKLEAASYYVTLTASGSNYTVSYTQKKTWIGLRFIFDNNTGITRDAGNENNISVDVGVKGETYYGIGDGIWGELYKTFDDGSMEKIQTNTGGSISTSSTSSRTQWSGKSHYCTWYSNGRIYLQYTTANAGQFTSVGATGFSATATMSLTEGGVTKSVVLNFFFTGNISVSSAPDLCASSVGQIITPYVEGRAAFEYGNSNISAYISSCSIDNTTLVTNNGNKTFTVKSNADFESKSVITSNLSINGTTVPVSQNLWGWNATKDFLIFYHHYWDSYDRNYQDVLNTASGTWYEYDMTYYELGEELGSIGFYLIRVRGDGAREDLLTQHVSITIRIECLWSTDEWVIYERDYDDLPRWEKYGYYTVEIPDLYEYVYNGLGGWAGPLIGNFPFADGEHGIFCLRQYYESNDDDTVLWYASGVSYRNISTNTHITVTFNGITRTLGANVINYYEE